MVRKYVGEIVYNSFVKPVVKAFTKPQKTTGTEVIKSVPVAKNLKKKKEVKDDMVKSFDKALSGVRDQAKVEIKSRNPLSKFTKKAADIIDKKAKGGRVGLKRGTGLKKPSNVEKIKKAFGPKEKPQSRMTRKKKFPDLTGDGKVTFADILKGRGVINGKKKKKVI